MAFVLVVATVLGPSGPRALGPLVLAFVPPASAGAWAFGPAEAWALRGPVLFVALWGFWAGRWLWGLCRPGEHFGKQS